MNFAKEVALPATFNQNVIQIYGMTNDAFFLYVYGSFGIGRLPMTKDTGVELWPD